MQIIINPILMTINPSDLPTNAAIVSLINGGYNHWFKKNETKLTTVLKRIRSNDETLDIDSETFIDSKTQKKHKQKQQRRHVRFAIADNDLDDDTTKTTTSKRHHIRKSIVPPTTTTTTTSAQSSSYYVLTPQLKSKMWYSSNEMKQFLLKCHRFDRPTYYEQILIDALFYNEKGNNNDNDDDNDNDNDDDTTTSNNFTISKRRILSSSNWRYEQTRGLELWCSKVSTQRKKNHTKIVLNLANDSSSTDEFLSNISSISSQQSKVVAQIFAQLDSMMIDDDDDDDEDYDDFDIDFDIELGCRK